MRQVYLTDVSTSVLVWAEGEYLVEHYLMHPLIEVVPHSHPFESVTVHVAGKLLGRRQGIIGQWLTDRDSGHISNPIAPGVWHAFMTGDTGAVMYVISRWKDPAEQDSATRKYLGEPLGPLHQQTLHDLERDKLLARQP